MWHCQSPPSSHLFLRVEEQTAQAQPPPKGQSQPSNGAGRPAEAVSISRVPLPSGILFLSERAWHLSLQAGGHHSELTSLGEPRPACRSARHCPGCPVLTLLSIQLVIPARDYTGSEAVVAWSPVLPRRGQSSFLSLPSHPALRCSCPYSKPSAAVLRRWDVPVPPCILTLPKALLTCASKQGGTKSEFLSGPGTTEEALWAGPSEGHSSSGPGHPGAQDSTLFPELGSQVP